MSTIIANGDKLNYDLLQLNSYKKIIAEDDKFIALKIWEHSYDEKRSIYKTFQKHVNYMISDYIVRSDNMTSVKPDNHFVESKSLYVIDTTIISWLYNTSKEREGKCLTIDIDMMTSKELASPIVIKETSEYIQNKIAKEII